MEPTTPDISVIIPTYNRANTIRYCLDSVVNQTLPPKEVIVVDDCSTDHTCELVKAYGHPAVKLIVLKEQSGAQKARNAGIKRATGKWICFLDSDDAWETDKLEKQVRELKKQKPADEYIVIHGNCRVYKPHLNRYEAFPIHHIEGKGKTLRRKLLHHPAPFFQAMLTSRKVLEEIGYLDEKVPAYQEWETSIQLAKKCRFIHLQDTLFTYHLHNGETVSKDKARDVLGYHYIRIKYKQDIIREFGSLFYHLDLLWNILRALKYKLPFADQLLAESYAKHQGISLLYKSYPLLRRQPTLALQILSKVKTLLSNP